MSFGLAAWALWFYIFIAVGRFGELIPGLTAIPLAKIAISISLLALISDKQRYEKKPWGRSGIIGTAVAVFVIATLLIPASVQVGASLRFMLSTALPTAVAFYMINRICVSWRQTKMTLLVLIFSAANLSLFAIAGGNERISAGSSYDTNDLAYILVTSLPITVAFAYGTLGKKRLLLLAAAALMLLAALLTQSRGGLLGAIVATSFLILRPYSGDGRNLWKVLMAGLLVLVAGYSLFSALPHDVQRRFATLGALESDYNLEEGNLTGRMSIWRRGMNAAVTRPIGYGPLTFQQVDLMEGGKYKAPHNSYLQIAVELGLLGLLLFLRLYYLSWRTMLSLKKFLANFPGDLDSQTTKELVAISVGIRASLLANMVAGFFLSQAYSGLLWTLFAVCAAISTLMSNPKTPSNTMNPIRSF